MIRKFEKNDIHAVMQIWINENIKAHSFISRKYWEENVCFVEEALPKAEIYVYVIENKIAGFIGLDHEHIEGVFVDTNYQGHGIGGFLLEKAKEHRHRLTLSVYKKNKHAIEFYKKKGFVIFHEDMDEQTKEMAYVMMWSADDKDGD